MASTTARKHTFFGTVAVVALTMAGGLVAAAPAQAVCSGAYFSENTSAVATVRVPANCSNGSQVRSRKDWYYTDNTNGSVGKSYGPWISESTKSSRIALPAGRFHKTNTIESQ